MNIGMKADELTIGCWVEFVSKHGYGLGQITGIEPREGSVEPTTFNIIQFDKDGKTKLFIGVSRHNARPVPLTKEMLEKQKFDPMDCSWWENTEFENDCKNEYLWWHIVVTGNTLVVQGEIRYVHELQMALKLCGLEHEFKL